MKRILATATGALFGLLPLSGSPYPLDGYQDTGIRRVEGSRLAHEGLAKGGKQPPGALLPTEQVDLRLLDSRDLELPAPDPGLTRQLRRLLGENADRYAIAVLDLSDPEHPRYAEHRGDVRQNMGSVGKVLAAVGLFQALADTWPDDLRKRRQILKDTLVTGDDFTLRDQHKVRLFNVETRKLTRRILQPGDQGSLWEWLDWTLSLSANAGASMVMREAMLIRHFGKAYPASEQKIQRFFEETPRKELTALFQRTFMEPLTRNGLDLERLRQGSFFTRQGKHKVPGGANSYGTPHEFMKLLLRMEQGRLVDEWSSRELKRLLYITERRIRYASHPALADAAVYFKSGSLYSCREEPGFVCKKYHGNVKNFMSSVAVIESPAGDYRLHYMVTLNSNVLRKNSAVDHQTLAMRIHRLLEKAQAPATPAKAN